MCLGVLPACDRDHDGWRRNADCDDSNGSVHPGAPEICDGLDQDCDGRIDDGLFDDWYRDADGDGVGAGGALSECRQPPGYVLESGDCDDHDPRAHPDHSEICDGVDNDCDGYADVDAAVAAWFYRDADGDGFAVPSGNDIRCAAEPGFTDRVGDCDDSDATRSPVATETCNGVDDDCDGQTDEVASCG